MDVEIDLLSMEYRQIRISHNGAIRKLMCSIEQFGQRVPVIIIKKDEPSPTPWILIDGYLRCAALKKLNTETIDAQVWDCDLQQALLKLLLNHQSRKWFPFEESLLLRTLQVQQSLSQVQLAMLVGKSQSWVNNRLAVTQFLPEQLQESILDGEIPIWTALRILLPIARAIPQHAQQLQNYMSCHPSHSTRELQFFYDHYTKSTRSQKDSMVADPELFFKSQSLLYQERQAKKLRHGPESRWQAVLKNINALIAEAKKLRSSIFYTNQTADVQEAALKIFNIVAANFDNLKNEVIGEINDR